MKNISLMFILMGLLGLGVACDRQMDRGDEIEREEVGEEIGHEMDEMGDNMRDAGEEVVD